MTPENSWSAANCPRLTFVFLQAQQPLFELLHVFTQSIGTRGEQRLPLLQGSKCHNSPGKSHPLRKSPRRGRVLQEAARARF